MIALYPGTGTEILEEFRNAHGSAPYVWSTVGKHYLGMTEYEFFSRSEEIWPLYKRPDMPRHHRAVLMMSYDNAVVAKEHYAQAAKDIRAFLADFPPNPEHANHWAGIALIFERNPDCPAIGFWMTSVSENPFEGPWNDEREAHDEPDWSQFWSTYLEVAKWDKILAKAPVDFDVLADGVRALAPKCAECGIPLDADTTGIRERQTEAGPVERLCRACALTELGEAVVRDIPK